MTARSSFFVTCAPGIEPVLHEEAKALKLAKLERQVGGVRFEGTLADAWRANLELRTAVRVLQELVRFEAADADALYAGAREVDWERFLGPQGSLVVDARSTQSALDHTQFVEQRVKDAIVDRFRERHDARPRVDKDAPDLRVHVHLFRDRCRLLADTSGESLHKRGRRRFQGRAPLAETLAAACVLRSGWDRRAPLLDPFAGSGTILTEAASLAANEAPGLARVDSGPGFAFERWPGHDAAGWSALIAAARARVAPPRKLTLWGGDVDAETVAGAQENLAAAELDERVTIERADARDLAPRAGWNAWIVSNLPYGERVGARDELAPLFRAFGALLRERCAGYRAAFLSGDPRLAKALGLRFDERLRVLNGGLECELLQASFP